MNLACLQIAIENDCPEESIVGDDVLQLIAAQHPTTMRALLEIEGTNSDEFGLYAGIFLGVCMMSKRNGRPSKAQPPVAGSRPAPTSTKKKAKPPPAKR